MFTCSATPACCSPSTTSMPASSSPLITSTRERSLAPSVTSTGATPLRASLPLCLLRLVQFAEKLDVGSAGAYSFPGFRKYVVEPSQARIYCLLNLSAIGLIAPSWEFANLDYCDINLAARMIAEHRDVILGIKARIDNNTTRQNGIRPLEMARTLADQVDLPLMVHIGNGPPPFDQIASLLRPGDILTHCFTGGTHRIIRPDGTVDPLARELQQCGVLLDIGHGTGSFAFDVAESAMDQGIIPDVISSDIHQLSVQGPMFDLPTTLSKFLNLGMSLPAVIERATVRPARAMRRPELGTLAIGSVADIALFQIEQGSYTFHDVQMAARPANQPVSYTHLTLPTNREV